MKKIFVTYGDSVFEKSKKRIIKEAKSIDYIFFKYLYKLRRKVLPFRWLLILMEKIKVCKVLDEEQYEKLRAIAASNNKHNLFLSLVSSYSEFYRPNNAQYMSELFRLQPSIATLLDEETKLFNDHTIGVHIRRTDNEVSIAESPLELFVERMNSLIEENPKVNFYLASDSEDVKNEMKRIYKDRVILPNGVLERDSEAGIIQAVIEMYSLSKTSRILGSFYSSYSTMASEIGDISIEYLKKK